MYCEYEQGEELEEIKIDIQWPNLSDYCLRVGWIVSEAGMFVYRDYEDRESPAYMSEPSCTAIDMCKY